MKRSLFGTLIWKTFISILRRCVENFSYGFKTLVKFDIKITTGFARGGQGRGVVVRCTHGSHGFCTQTGHFASLVASKKSASLHRFAAYRGTSLRSWFRTCKTSGSSKKASLRRFAAYRGTSLRSWFQKKCPLPIWISFFPQHTPTFEN